MSPDPFAQPPPAADDDLLPDPQPEPVERPAVKIDKRTGAEYTVKPLTPSGRPAAYGGGVLVALNAVLALLAAFGVDADLSAEQSAAVVSAVNAVVAVVTAFVVQRHTTPWGTDG